MSRVYGWMTGGLCLTGVVAWNVSGNPQLVQTIFGNPMLLWGLVIAQLGAVIGLSWLINRISGATATLIYFLYAGVESWNKSHDETEENYFHEVCFIYVPLLELVPPGELWDNVLESYINFLKQPEVERESPPEWYFEVRRLLELDDAEPATQEKVRLAVKAKGDLVMSMYADLDRLAGSQTKR